MSTIQDYRRTDIRSDVSGESFWLVSKVIDGHEITGLKDKACVLFSFPDVGKQVIIREIAIHVLRVFTVGTTLELGLYTLTNDGLSTNDTATVVDDDCFVEATDIQPEVVGWYYPSTGGFVDARASGIISDGDNLIVGAVTSVPCVAISPKVATIITGQVQVAMYVTFVPGS